MGGGNRVGAGGTYSTECDCQEPIHARTEVPAIHLLVHLFINVHCRNVQNCRIYKVLLLCGDVGILTRVDGTRWMHCSGSATLLFREQQIFSEGPLFIDPLRLTAETGGASHKKYFFRRVFVAAFGPDGFALEKFN